MQLNIKKLNKFCYEKVDDYFVFDEKIKKLKDQLETSNSRDINSSIQSKNKVNRSVENEVIKKIVIENKINEIILWRDIVEQVLNQCKKTSKYKYEYYIERFMNRKTDYIIQAEMLMSPNTQSNYKKELVLQISLLGISKNLIIVNDFIDE